MNVLEIFTLVVGTFLIGPVLISITENKIWLAEKFRTMLVILCYGVSGNMAFTGFGLIVSPVFLEESIDHWFLYAILLIKGSIALTYAGLYFSEKEK
jgi:hypothetical protein